MIRVNGSTVTVVQPRSDRMDTMVAHAHATKGGVTVLGPSLLLPAGCALTAKCCGPGLAHSRRSWWSTHDDCIPGPYARLTIKENAACTLTGRG
jgi:hypothetical protein